MNDLVVKIDGKDYITDGAAAGDDAYSVGRSRQNQWLMTAMCRLNLNEILVSSGKGNLGDD